MGVPKMILTENVTSIFVQDDRMVVHVVGKALHNDVSASDIDLDLICPKRNILRFQFMLSFIQFFLTLLSGMSFVSFNKYSCPTFFMLCCCASVVHSAVMMTSAIPTASVFFICVAAIFGILLLVTYWVTYCQYVAYWEYWGFDKEITWNTMIQLRWNILIMTTTIGVNVMVALCGHLPNVELYTSKEYPVACKIFG